MNKTHLGWTACALAGALLLSTLADAAPRRSASRASRPAPHATAPAAADAGASTGDVRCLLISRLLMQSSDVSRQAMGAAGSLFFSARLQGRMTDRQIENALVADAQTAPPSPDQTKGCGARLDARLQELDGISQRADARLDVISPRPATPEALPPSLLEPTTPGIAPAGPHS
jgi:hypothetical protein